MDGKTEPLAQLLYEDRFVRLDEHGVQVTCFYFPGGSSCKLPYGTITKVNRVSDPLI
jgi:hypothetical protein